MKIISSQYLKNGVFMHRYKDFRHSIFLWEQLNNIAHIHYYAIYYSGCASQNVDKVITASRGFCRVFAAIIGALGCRRRVIDADNT